MMSKWTYFGEVVNEPPEDQIGFIYRISSIKDLEVNGVIFKKGVYYIGQKQFYSNRTTVLSKKKSNELWKGRGAKPKKQKVTKNSDWLTYCSSSTILLNLVSLHGEESFRWEIIGFACSTSGLDYLEAKEILNSNALLDDSNLNVWLSLKIRRNNICI